MRPEALGRAGELSTDWRSLRDPCEWRVRDLPATRSLRPDVHDPEDPLVACAILRPREALEPEDDGGVAPCLLDPLLDHVGLHPESRQEEVGEVLRLPIDRGIRVHED